MLGLTVQCEFANSQTNSNNSPSTSTSTLTFGSPALVSTKANGVAGNGSSFHANFSPDGKHLLFWSNSTNFVSGLTNGNQQLYIKDLTTGVVALVSADANGVEGNDVSINVNNSCQVLMFSPDGTKVVFETASVTLVPSGTNGNQQIFLKDLTTGAVTLVSADANGVQGNGDSLTFSFSPDGTKVAFDSSSSNLLPVATHTDNIFVKDLATGAVTLVSAAANGVEGNNISSQPVFSPDGTQIAFASFSNNLVPGATNIISEIYVKNLASGAITLVSADANGIAGNGSSLLPQFSPDGTKVAFASGSGNLIPGGTNGSEQVYLKDLATAAVTLVSADTHGVPANSNNSQLPVFTPDGTKIAFESAATNLVPGGSAGEQVFLKDLPTGAVVIVSTDANGVPGNNGSSDPNFSRDQSQLAFQSTATSLGVPNGTTQIFVRQITTQFAPAVTTSPSSLTITPGQTASFTAAATGTPSPTIQWQVSTDGGVTFSNITGATSTTLTFTASLSQNGNLFQAVFTNSVGSATSSAAQLTVLNPAATTALVSSANPSAFGQAVTFTATVSSPSGTPTGTVTFLNGATSLGAATLGPSGMASLTTAALAVGPHSITASYGGDTNFNASSSSSLSQTVNRAATTVTSISSANPSVFGQGVTLSAVVAPVSPGAGSPSGTVTFQDGATSLGTSALTNGKASFTTSSLAAAAHSITAVYNGDGNFNAASSAPLAQAVNKASSSANLTSSANPALFNQSVTFTATVAAVAPGAGAPTGTVSFLDGGASLGSASLAGGQATFTSSSLSIASHSITAVYVGDGNFTGSSAALTETVTRPTALVTLSSSLNPSLLNQPFVLTAKVTAAIGTPTGTISFQDGATALGTSTLNSSGVATLTLSKLAAGSHVLTAVYSGDASFSGVTSAAFTQTVQYAPAGTSCDGGAGHQILQPIDPAGSSVFKQRRTVPAKFRVCDANGNSIGGPGVVSSFALVQVLNNTTTSSVQVVDATNPDTAFRWDPSGQQWISNISTANLTAGNTYVYAITLNDGSTILFQYGLR
jgi:Tol biopolymer transport system component